MTEFVSGIAPLIKQFIDFRIVSEYWNASYEVNMRLFDRHCHRQHPGENILTQQMVDEWCVKRKTETGKSCQSRCYVIVSFVKHLRSRGATEVNPPQLPRKSHSTYVPHAFSEDELRRFFEGCDNLSGPLTKDNRIRNISVPVFFRLLYSSGLRTTEARLLRKEDVNLEAGVLNIRLSKGYDQHFVVLHDSMTQLMRKYDEAISRIMPERVYFFPSRTNSFHDSEWVSVNFRKIWRHVSSCRAVPYELRHHYATANINSWINCGMDIHSRLLYLSKSMGHSVIESTAYYYSLVPGLSDIIKEKTRQSFDDIVPDLTDTDYEETE